MLEFAGTALIAFIGGGLVGWFGRPMAEVKAGERKSRVDRRRALIDGARALIGERQVGTLDLSNPVAGDPRFQAIKPHLSEGVAARCEKTAFHISVGGHMSDLAGDVDRLEKKWKLV